jgi:hypothetical protein
VRPLFFCFLLTSVGGLIILGLVGEIYILRHDPEYGAKSENWTRYWLILPFAIVLSGYLLIHACSVGTDYLKFAVGHAKLREVTATITDRKGPPGMFIFADQLTLSGGQDLSLPYSDLPAVGGTYRFTMLPTENVALSYGTVRPSH